MKLYYSPGACSQAAHIALYESCLPFTVARVDIDTKRVAATGADYLAIAPKGAVPALELPDGQILTEGAAVLHYIADQAPTTHLMPPVATMAYYRELEWLNWLASELHKAFHPLFHPADPADRARGLADVETKLAYANSIFGHGPWLQGDTFTVADAYLFVILGWTKPFHLDLARWPKLAAFRHNALARPAVKAALHAEGFAA